MHLPRCCTMLGLALLGLALSAPAGADPPTSRLDAMGDRLTAALRLETDLRLGDRRARGGFGLWRPVAVAGRVAGETGGFRLGFDRKVDAVTQTSPVMLGVRIMLGNPARVATRRTRISAPVWKRPGSNSLATAPRSAPLAVAALPGAN